MNHIDVSQCTLTLSGTQLLTVIRGLHELPHKEVVTLLAEIERQVMAQHAPPGNPS